MFKSDADRQTVTEAYLAALAAFIIWGILPVYWHQLRSYPALEVLGHRIIWSFVYLLFLILRRRETNLLRRLLVTPRFLKAYFVTAMLLSMNWGLFIWAVQRGYVLECSLGYFLSPLVTFLMGALVLKESVRPLQWCCALLAAIGVTQMAIAYGAFPWVAIFLACSFSQYTLLRRRTPAESVPALAVETILMIPISVVALGYLYLSGQAFLPAASNRELTLLLCSGVATAFPLVLFSRAAKVVPFTNLGIIQYVGPVIQLLLGVYWFKEALDQARINAFCLVGLAVFLFSLEAFVAAKRAATSK